MRALLKAAGRTLSVTAAAAALLTLIRPRQAWFRLLLWRPKLLTAAFSPLLLLAGSLGLLLGRLFRDPLAFYGGTIGAVLTLRHIGRVVGRPPKPSVAFRLGPVPPAVRRAMLPRRWTVHWSPPPPAPCQREVAVALQPETGKPILADLWRPLPDVRSTGLAVLYLPGGLLPAGDGCVDAYPIRHLTAQGHHVLRLVNLTGDLFARVAAVKRVVAWLKAYSPVPAINPEAIILMGAGSGGHLALLSAYTARQTDFTPPDVNVSTAVRAVVSYYGPPDLETYQARIEQVLDLGDAPPALAGRLASMVQGDPAGQNPAEVYPALLGGRLHQVPDRYRLASPIHHACFDCPPTLLVQGGHDFSGLAPDVRRLHQRLMACGCTSVYLELPETEHGFDLFWPRWSAPAQVAMYELERFLAAML